MSALSINVMTMPSLKTFLREYRAVPVATTSLGATPTKVVKVTTRDEIKQVLANGKRKRSASTR
jgi:hypothetical protein